MVENSLLAETRELISQHRVQGNSIADPALKTLGFKERDLTDEERAKFRTHEYDSTTCYYLDTDGIEITIVDREWNRSKSFRHSGYRIEITLIVKDIKAGKAQEEYFSWDELTRRQRH